MRAALRNIYLTSLGLFLKPKPGIHILNSHFAYKNEADKVTMFKFLQNLNKNCDFIKFQDAVQLISSGNIPKNKVLVAFSFDDGLEECYTHIAPLLESYNVNAAFFINSGFIDNTTNYNEQRNILNDSLKYLNREPMTWDQLSDLNKRGHVIGSHTADHINLNTTDLLFAEKQISESKNRIEEMTGNTCNYFAFPYGRLIHINNDTLAIAEKYHQYIFSGTNYKNYYSTNKRIINRRHVEPFWLKQHINYFLNVEKKCNTQVDK